MSGELDTYRSMRDPARTPEPVPVPGVLPTGNDDTFVIQEHHASALHWDFRLERGGVLVSWAVPKGLPTDPATNRLAVHTEDHPLDYAAFEGTIPPGEYGGGSVRTWDRGHYECEKWTDREVKVVLHGSRARGRYVLFATGGRRGRDWMMHRMDPPDPGWQPLPSLVAPMLAVPGRLPAGVGGWSYEFKWDGVRAVVYADGGRVRAMSRNDKDVTASYPELRGLGEALGARQAVLDGELVALVHGRPSFSALQRRMHVADPAQARRLAETTPVTYLVFDVLHLDGRSLLDEPLSRRREVLDGLALGGPGWQTPPAFPADGEAVLAASKAQGLEGVVAKRLESRYLPGRRSEAWVKVKNVAAQEVVVGGWKPGRGRRDGLIGSLLLGVPDDDGRLHYAGHVGTGFTDSMLRDLAADLAPLAAPDSPFAEPMPRGHARDAVWVRPELVGEVEFTEWTPDGRLRHPSWRGLRPDKEAPDVRREPDTTS